MQALWLIPLLPAAGAAANGLLGIRWFSRRLSGVLACAAIGGALVLSVWLFAALLGLPPHARVLEVTPGDWIPPIPLATTNDIGLFRVPWSLRLDPLSAVMLLVITIVGFLIHVYSTAYMKDEPRGGHARFFCYLNLFCAFMLLLVLAGNFLVLFIGWEGVGLCSYLLIGFWYEKPSAADAGKKAFLVNRIGDWAFLLGIFLVFVTFGTLDFREVASAAAAMPVEAAGFGVLSFITLLLFAGATGKSAQIPLFVWLPDAMEGPTPVSALMHAATMVTAGVYIVGRNAVLFEHAPLVMRIVAIVGALTAIMAGSVALVQNDIKRVLAYSTISQLGYMFLATGVGAFAAAVFHLFTHGFIKALLFLGSGSVIHAVAGEQDLQRMGGLRRYMPLTFIAMVLGGLALAGIPPFAGFFSKDEILYRAFLGNKILWAIAAATALLTAFYMFRLIALAFYGSYRGPAGLRAASPAAAAQAADHGAQHPHDPHAHGHAQQEDHEVTHGPATVIAGWHGPHEAPAVMTWPLMALAIGALVAGFVGIPHWLGGVNAIERFLAPSFTVNAGANAIVPSAPADTGALPLTMFAMLLGVAGILLARQFYVVDPALPARLAARTAGVHALLVRSFYVDALYDAAIVRQISAAARALWNVDRRFIDGAVDASSAATRIASWLSHMLDKHVFEGVVTVASRGARRGSFLIRRAQTGLVQNYALLMVAGLFVLLTIFLLAR